ncbi:MAG TPA: M90 family metallopeptidase [Burkholderiaceae bacterium]
MALLLTLLLALALATFLATQPLRQQRRRARIMAQPFPQAWRRILRRRVPLVASLPADLQLRLKGLMQVFLAEKPIIGCQGLEVTDDMRVTVAALACLPLLGRSRGIYPELRQVLMYPGAFVVDRPVNAAGGVQMEQRRALSGESWVQGQVLLSWQDVLHGAALPDDGHNVVIHEFAHQLDQAKGFANGAPLLGSRAAYQSWSAVLQREYQALQQRLARGEPGLIDPYGATDPAEFFAVVSELFFERGAELAALHPALYAELRRYYALDPLNWQ